jgi:hypothetical protein
MNHARSKSMATYQILTWHGIPAQVRAKGEGRERASAPLPDRFMQAIDAAAMAAGLTGSDDYTDAFEWSAAQEREGNAQAVASMVASEIDAEFMTINWRAIAQSIKRA